MTNQYLSQSAILISEEIKKRPCESKPIFEDSLIDHRVSKIMSSGRAMHIGRVPKMVSSKTAISENFIFGFVAHQSCDEVLVSI